MNINDYLATLPKYVGVCTRLGQNRHSYLFLRACNLFQTIPPSDIDARLSNATYVHIAPKTICLAYESTFWKNPLFASTSARPRFLRTKEPYREQHFFQKLACCPTSFPWCQLWDSEVSAVGGTTFWSCLPAPSESWRMGFDTADKTRDHEAVLATSPLWKKKQPFDIWWRM